MIANLVRLVIACIALVIVGGGCAPITPYRTQLSDTTNPCVAHAASQCPKDTFFLIKNSDDSVGDIPLAIIEFDDQGVLQDRPAKERIMQRIRRLTEDHGAFVVVFAHGWKNNAAPDNGNLAQFQGLLRRIAGDDRAICENRSCATRKVIGVYLGWRGLSATLEPFASLSFWNRKSRAERIGQDGATEVLADLAKTQRGSTSNKDKSRLLVIGHSFGGGLVYSATQQLFMTDAASETGGEAVDRTVANMVILINPAFEAARMTSLHDRAAEMKFKTDQRPILAIFTSETDSATKRAFPLGRFVSSMFTKYNPARPDQRALDRTAIGHFAAYQTHELRPGDRTAAEVTRVMSQCRWEAFGERGGSSWDTGSVVLRRKNLATRQEQWMNPYYNVVVDDAIISGHSGYWTPTDFMTFITRFVMVQDDKNCAKLKSESESDSESESESAIKSD